MKRLFVAINLTESAKKEINAIIKGLRKIKELKEIKNIRWMPPENWHLTITFLGYQSHNAIDLILKSMQEIAKDFNAPIVEFKKAILAPPNKTARMIWLTTTKETSQILSKIKNELESNLIKNSVKFKQENREYNGHVALARFANQSRISSREFFANIQKELAKFNAEKIKEISFVPQSLDLMESHLKYTGSEYKILASIKI